MPQYRNFYPFFFTHLSQQITLESIGPWMEIERPTHNELTLNDDVLSSIYFQVSGDQPQGVITYTTKNGQYSLDCSSTLNITNSKILASTTLQDITNYYLEINTPINPPYLKKLFTYTLAFDEDGSPVVFEQTYPNSVLENRVVGRYPNQIVTTYQKIENPWFVENSVFLTSDVPEGTDVYAELTIDTSSITTDQSTLTNYGSSVLTADRSTYTREHTLEDTEFLDLSPDFLSPKRVTIERNPIGLSVLNWLVSGNSISRTWVPSLNRGYLPCDTVGKVMSGADLKSVALSLLGLIAHKDDSLLTSVLEELCYMWSYLKTTYPDIKGLPSFIPRVLDNPGLLTDTKRRVHDNAWVGLSIVKSVRFLRDRNAANTIELPSKLEGLLNDLADLVGSAIDETTATVYVGYDEDGYILDELDLSAGYISHLFLHSLLTFNYSSTVHSKASFLFLDIEKELEISEDDLVFLQYEQTIGEVIISKLYWNVSNNLHASSTLLCNQLNEFLESNKLDSFYHGLLDYLLPYIPNKGNLVLDSISDKSQYIVSGIYTFLDGSLNLPKPDLCISTWMRINIIGFNILPELDFDLYSYGARVFLAEQYQEAVRMMPFGYGWASETAESAYTGNLGALLYSSVFSSFTWYLLYELVRNGIHLLTAQAWALDDWGYSLKRDRPKFQSDTYFRNTLFFSKNKLLGTKLGLLQLVDAIYAEPVEFIDPIIRTASFQGTQTDFTSNPQLVTSITDTTLVTADRPRYPTSNLIEFGNTATLTWSQAVGILNVYSNKYLPDIEEEILNSISAGVEANIFVCDYDRHKINTFTS
jgi:hypothetical protein